VSRPYLATARRSAARRMLPIGVGRKSDLETPLLGAVECLIDFVTAE
jgi:hypothetical protein